MISPIFYNVPLYCCWDGEEGLNLFRHWRISLPKLGCCRIYFSFDVLEAIGNFSYSFLMCSLWMPKTFQDLKGEGKYFCNIWPFPHPYRYIFVRSSSICRTWGEHVVYRNCSECQKQFLYTTCSPHVLSLEFSCIELVIQWKICRHILG